MTPTDRREGARALQAVLTAILASGGVGTGQDAADQRRRVGALSASASDRVEAGDFGPDLRACFEAATYIGATFDGMNAVWLAASGVTSDRGPVRRVVQTSVRFALVQMCIILSRTTFQSRANVDAAVARINTAFEPAEEFAADGLNATVYRALVALHAATIRDLTQRGRPLPRVVAFDVGSSLPALTLSNRLYGDGSRVGELIAENRVVHPLFMRGAGRALAN